MITVQQVKALLNKHKEVQQEGVKLQATLNNYKTLQSQAEKNNTAIVKRMIEINDAIREVEANNNSLQKAVEDKGNVQAVINTQEECFAILDEIEELMTAPQKVGEAIPTAKIEECKEALKQVEDTRDTLVIPTECNTFVLKQPVARPIVKKQNPQPQTKAVADVEVVSTAEFTEPQKCEEQTETTTKVETITVEKGATATEEEKTQKFLGELA